MSEEKISKTQEFRQKVAERFIAALQEDPLVWRKGWNTVSMLPVNAITGKKYRGINQLSLYMLSLMGIYSDPRFATFKQIQDKGWKLNNAKGAGIKVEYWFPYDQKSKRYCDWNEYKEWIKTEDPKKNIILLSKYYTVFNAKHIEGIPELEMPEVNTSITMSELIPKMCKNMGLEILNDGGNKAYYSIVNDNIHMPEAGRFISQAEYDATCTHELSHATGALHRLHRFEQSIPSNQRAIEELIAEISSSFLSVHFQQPAAPMLLSGPEMENHMAYVQSWIEEIKNKPETLMRAIKDAENAASYLELQAEIISEKEYQNIQGKAIEISAEKQGNVKMTLEMVLEKMQNTLTEEEALRFIKQTAWEVSDPVFEQFHNVIRNQKAEFVEGKWKAELFFSSNYDPRINNLNTADKSKNFICTHISLLVHPRNADDMEVLLRSKQLKLWGRENKSVRTGQKTYLNVLEKWKEVTGQEKILFPIAVHKTQVLQQSCVPEV